MWNFHKKIDVRSKQCHKIVLNFSKFYSCIIRYNGQEPCDLSSTFLQGMKLGPERSECYKKFFSILGRRKSKDMQLWDNKYLYYKNRHYSTDLPRFESTLNTFMAIILQALRLAEWGHFLIYLKFILHYFMLCKMWQALTNWWYYLIVLNCLTFNKSEFKSELNGLISSKWPIFPNI